ncbi:hypothetical protein GQ43DRAFT_121277 [Delitschia confertaspora ATCC 74209]|uniref:EamA domain-containing protein n=1 Tax=Delitschia confertaspora ATCC 74209 TaxID=1513339 RepID=A0A9P4MT10_9PLEO|nr:hypothetical protein GQ43DRAFT_121277 [Delitschia confertaspora ATCC 74209]
MSALSPSLRKDLYEEHEEMILSDLEEAVSPSFAADTRAKPEQDCLNVLGTGQIRRRSPSPNPSSVSIIESEQLRVGRSPNRDISRLDGDGRYASRSPAPPWTLKERLAQFWGRNKGLALVLLSQFFGSLMNVTTRLLEMNGNHGKGYHPFQILFARMSITVACSSLYMWFNKTDHFPLGQKGVRLLLVARGLTGFFGVFGLYYSLQYLPLADATVITFLAPSLSCWLCSILLAEPFTRMEQIAAYVSLFGVVLIARPTSLFSSSRSNSAPPVSVNGDSAPLLTNGTITADAATGVDHIVTPGQRAAAVAVAMLGVLGATGAYTTLRWIGKRAHPLISVNYFSAWCTIVSVVMLFALPNIGFEFPATWKDWCYLVFLGMCGFIMQFLLAAGLQHEKSSRATNMMYTQMLFALSFDKLVWGTTPGVLSIIGSSLILGSAIYVAVQKENAGMKKEGRGERDEEEHGLMESEDAVEEVTVEERNRGMEMRSLRS